MGLGDIDAGIAEAGDVGESVASDIPEFARIGVVAAPAAGRGMVAERGNIRSGGAKSAVAVAEGKIGVVATDPDDVGLVVAVDVGEVSRELILAGPAARCGGGAEPLESEEGLREVTVGR